MTTRKSSPSLALAILATLTLAAGAANAEGRSCLFDAPRAQAPRVEAILPDASVDMQMPPEVMQRMAQIDQALRGGQITALQAGRLMRQQWELAQFRRGFIDGGQSATAMAPRLAPRATQGAGACNLIGDLGSTLAPLGGMAVNGMQTGMQTATTVMRALMREAEKLMREEAAQDGFAL